MYLLTRFHSITLRLVRYVIQCGHSTFCRVLTYLAELMLLSSSSDSALQELEVTDVKEDSQQNEIAMEDEQLRSVDESKKHKLS